MALTLGSGPHGNNPAGQWNVPMPGPEGLLYFEDSPRWVRARFGGETVADSRRMKLLHEHGRLPVYWFPKHDVRADLVEPSGRVEEHPLRGPVHHHHVRAGGRMAEHAAMTCPEPPEEASFLRGYVSFDFHAMDEWLEEEEPIDVHPKDPYHRVDVRRTSRRVRVSVNGELLADSADTLVLFESGLPPRWYFPREDVRMDLLTPTDKRTSCPYKGHASYFSAAGEDDLVWTYEQPRHGAADVKGYLAFFNEHVDIEVDGQAVERPITEWSR